MKRTDESVEEIEIRFMLKNGSKMTDWERFEIFVHHSGTVAVEVGRVTYYTFRQQIDDCVRVEAMLAVLSPADSSSDTSFGSFCVKRKGQTEVVSVAAMRTQGLIDFVESVVQKMDCRFHDQCRNILASASVTR